MKKLAFLLYLFFLNGNIAFADNYYCPKQIKCKRLGQERYCDPVIMGHEKGLLGWGGDIFEGVYKLIRVTSYGRLVSCIYDPTFPSTFSIINIAFQSQYQANLEGLTKWQPMEGSPKLLKCENLPNLDPQDCPLKGNP